MLEENKPNEESLEEQERDKSAEEIQEIVPPPIPPQFASPGSVPPPIPPSPNFQSPRRSKKGLIIGLSVVLFVVLVVCGVLVYIDQFYEPSAEESEYVSAPQSAPAAEPAAAPYVEATDSDKTAPSAAAVEAPAFDPTREHDYNLSGKVGKYSIKMEINLDDNRITGRYKYTKSGWLTLYGRLEPSGISGGEIYLEAYTDEGNQCDSWKGTYTMKGRQMNIKGTMWNYKGDPYSFNASGHAE